MAELAMDDRQLQALARRAYERGRARLGLTRAAVVAPVAALAFLQCTSAFPIALAVAVLAGLVGLLSWRGQDYGRGGRAGLVAGLAPFAVPLLSSATGILCGNICVVMPAACVAGGLLGGLALAVRLQGRPGRGSRFWLSALAVTLSAGAVGCLGAGLMGLFGMAAGLFGGATPGVVLRHLRPTH
jgi:hypothetical protein